MTIRLSSPVRYGRICDNVHHKKARFSGLISPVQLRDCLLEGNQFYRIRTGAIPRRLNRHRLPGVVREQYTRRFAFKG
jgi:hypothetical protein